MNTTLRLTWTTVRAYLIYTLVLGIIYPVALWGVGRIWASNADGSIIYSSTGQAQGSAILAQPVTEPGFFYPRPSAAGDDGWDPMSSSASNVSPYSTDYQAELEQRREDVAEREGVSPEQVPDDAVAASGSGLDPHISLDYARLQAPRVAEERGVSTEEVEQLIDDNTSPAITGMPTGPLVNVVELNAAVAAQLGG